MFGNNKKEPIVKTGGEKLAVREIFFTIQGEGPKAGHPATFVRLGGCNLACDFCDTDFELSKSKTMTVLEIAAAVQDASQGRSTLVVVTGGEPLRQPLGPLILQLLTGGFAVQIETSGSVAPSWPDSYHRGQVEIVVSPKTPKVDEEIAKRAHAWKYVVEHDCAFYGGIPDSACQGATKRKPLAFPPQGTPSTSVFLQPCDHRDPEQNRTALLRAVGQCLNHGYRLSIQTHKIAGVP